MTQQPPAHHPPMPQSPPPAPAPTGIVGAPAVPPATSFAATLGDAAAAPHAMPAPPPPGPPAAMPAPADLGAAAFPTLVQPATPAAALDVTEPLAAPAPPPASAMPTSLTPAAAPAAPAVPAAIVAEEPAPELARPTLEATLAAERPDPIGGVAAADSADLRDLHARRGAAPAPADDSAPATGIWSPGIALIVATAALTLQLVAIYAREALPNVVASGQQLDQFDVLVRDLPLLDSKVASLGALLLGCAAVGIVLMGWKRGIRDVPLQAAVGIIGVLAILGATLVPALLG